MQQLSHRNTPVKNDEGSQWHTYNSCDVRKARGKERRPGNNGQQPNSNLTPAALSQSTESAALLTKNKLGKTGTQKSVIFINTC